MNSNFVLYAYGMGLVLFIAAIIAIAICMAVRAVWQSNAPRVAALTKVIRALQIVAAAAFVFAIFVVVYRWVALPR